MPKNWGATRCGLTLLWAFPQNIEKDLEWHEWPEKVKGDLLSMQQKATNYKQAANQHNTWAETPAKASSKIIQQRTLMKISTRLKHSQTFIILKNECMMIEKEQSKTSRNKHYKPG